MLAGAVHVVWTAAGFGLHVNVVILAVVATARHPHDAGLDFDKRVAELLPVVKPAFRTVADHCQNLVRRVGSTAFVRYFRGDHWHPLWSVLRGGNDTAGAFISTYLL